MRKFILLTLLFFNIITGIKAQPCTVPAGPIAQNTQPAICYSIPPQDTIEMCFSFTAPGSILLFASIPASSCFTVIVTAQLYTLTCTLVNPAAFGIVFTTPGQNYIWCIRYICNGTHDTIYCPTFQDLSALSVTWLGFTAALETERVHLQWSTASETNTAVFDILRARNDTSFNKIGTVPAAGNSTSTRNYSYDDYNLPKEKEYAYYRLKAVNRDGTFTYSNIIAVRNRNDEGTEIIYDIYGRVMHAAKLQPGAYIGIKGITARKIFIK